MENIMDIIDELPDDLGLCRLDDIDYLTMLDELRLLSRD